MGISILETTSSFSCFQGVSFYVGEEPSIDLTLRSSFVMTTCFVEDAFD